MANGSDDTALKYAAFISYSRQDRKVAQELQRSLERFVLPKAARTTGIAGRRGAGTGRPFPKVFRDEDELVPGGDLPGRIRDGIANSEFLVVVCSPAAARSEWVEKEILDFVELRGADRILALVVDGEPDAARHGVAPDLEPLPRALRYTIHDGRIGETEVQPLWLDWRGDHQADRLNFLRLVAALLSLGPTALDELRRRDEERARALRRLQRRIIAGVSTLAVIAVAAATVATVQRQRALHTQSRYLAKESLQYSRANRADWNRIAQIIALEGLPAGQHMIWPRPDDAFAEAALIRARYGPMLSLVLAGAKQVKSVAFSPDATRVITGSEAGTARVWSAETGAPVTPPLVNGAAVNAVTFSPDGARVLTASDDGTARIWNAETGAPEGQPMRLTGQVLAAAFSPDGKRIVTGGGAAFANSGEARVWNALTGAPLTPAMKHDAPVTHVAFSPDGNAIVTVCGQGLAQRGGYARVWDARTGAAVTPPLTYQSQTVDKLNSLSKLENALQSLVPSPLTNALQSLGASPAPGARTRSAGVSTINGATFSPDGKLVLTSAGVPLFGDGAAQLWDAHTGVPVGAPMQHRAAVMSASFSPDGRLILTTSLDRTARIWDVRGVPLIAPIGFGNFVLTGKFLRNPSRVLIGVSDLGKAGTSEAEILDLDTGKLLFPPLKLAAPLNVAAISPDGTKVLTLSAGTVRIWDIGAGQSLGRPMEHRGTIASARFSPDGSRIVTASADGTARVWQAASGRPLTPSMVEGHALVGAVFSPDGSKVLTFSTDGIARLWNAATGTRLGIAFNEGKAITFSAFSRDGTHVVTASRDGVARVWDARSGAALSPPIRHDNWVDFAIFSPDGSRLATASDDKVRVWDWKTGKLVMPPIVQGDSITAVAFSPDGTRLLTASDDRTARLWDAETGAPLTPPMKHDGAVTSAHFSPDGRRIVTTSGYRVVGSMLDFQSGGYAQIWDAATGLPVGPRLVQAKAVKWAAFSPDGSQIVTASDDGTARIWDAATGTALTPPLKEGAPMIFAAFSPDGRRIVTVAGRQARVWRAPERAGPRLIREACRTLARTGSEALPATIRVDTSTPDDGGPCLRRGLLSASYDAHVIAALWRSAMRRL